jgi:hypothetical protein
MSKPALVGLAIAAAIVIGLIYTSFGNRKFRCEVCVAFKGRTSCRIASAAEKESALRAATDNACAQIASGVTDTMVCTATQPQSVRWLSK